MPNISFILAFIFEKLKTKLLGKNTPPPQTLKAGGGVKLTPQAEKKFYFQMALDMFQRFNVQSQNETPKNGKKSTFQILKAHITKTIEVMSKIV